MSAKLSPRSNVRCEVIDDVLHINVSLDPAVVQMQPTASGKNVLIATTGTAWTLPNGIRFSTSVYAPHPSDEAREAAIAAAAAKAAAKEAAKAK